MATSSSFQSMRCPHGVGVAEPASATDATGCSVRRRALAGSRTPGDLDRGFGQRWCNDGMEPDRPSFFRRAVAVAILLVIAIIALRLVVGIVTGLITAALWIIVAAALIGGALWARSVLKSGKREKRVEGPVTTELRPQAGEDPVD